LATESATGGSAASRSATYYTCVCMAEEGYVPIDECIEPEPATFDPY
jgi:hypothetical protein